MTNTACMDTHLNCNNAQCLAFFNGFNNLCFFNEFIGVNTTVSEPIRCCFCNYSAGSITELWWNCDNATLETPLPSQTTMPSSSSSSSLSSNGEFL